MQPLPSQRTRAPALLRAQGMLRLVELRKAGITAATVTRMERAGEVIRLARGLYQLADADLDPQHALAAAAKRVPKGIVCLVSALGLHGLTDHIPRQVWMAIGSKDWAPQGMDAGIRIVRFPPTLLCSDVETQVIEAVPVRVFGVARTVADCFRYRRKIGLSLAIEGLRQALRQGKVQPAALARAAEQAGVATVVRPYLDALLADA